MIRTLRIAYRISALPPWATIDPVKVSKTNPHTIVNILDGKSITTSNLADVIDPMNGDHFMSNSLTDKELEQKLIDSQRRTPRWGLHNPIKNVGRYVMYGDVFFKIAAEMRKK
jgi:1-pyrroline-5-carboxylate dehydrogenase